jgi:putative DNA primase/helicase
MNYVTQPVESGNQTNDASNPALELGEVIDLHPLYAAMAQAREKAEANGTEPEDVVWDATWPEMKVDDDDYWNDLVDRNWEKLSRWYAMSLKAGSKSKALHFKIQNGIETCAVIDALKLMIPSEPTRDPLPAVIFSFDGTSLQSTMTKTIAPIATPKELNELRLKLHSHGYHPVPVIGAHVDTPSAGKRPTMPGWQAKCATADEEEIEKWARSQANCTNTGILCGRTVGVDIDVLDEALSDKLVARATELLGPTSLLRIGRAPKTLLVYRVAASITKLQTPALVFGDDPDTRADTDKCKVEILAAGQQFVAFGIHPATGQSYRWPEKTPLDVPFTDVPLVTLEQLQQFVDESEEILRIAGGRTIREIKDGKRFAEKESKNRDTATEKDAKAAEKEAEKRKKTANKESKDQDAAAEKEAKAAAKEAEKREKAANKESKDRDAAACKETKKRNNQGYAAAGMNPGARPSREKIASALRHIPNDLDYDEWIVIGFALYGELGDSGRDLWEAWSATYTGNDAKVSSAKWPSFKNGRSVSIGTLFWHARQNGWWWKERHVSSGVGNTTRDANEAAPSEDLPIIEIKDGQLSELATRAEALLIDAGVPVYQRGGELVRPIIETVDASRGRKTKVAQLRILDPVYLRDLLARHAIWLRYDKKEGQMNMTNPPYETATTVMGRAGEWKFKAISGVISTPTMRPDGSLLTEQGYDEVTGLLLVEPPPMPAIPDQPTRANALAALKLLEDLLEGFPFVDDVSKACALSAILTPILRGAFLVTPMHASRAPTAGSGKSFLWDIVAAIAIGQLMPVMSTGANVEETEKRLGAALMAGQPLISIDNISGELGGDALCQVIERPVVKIRILGRSEEVRIEARGTSTYATGNNFVVLGDLTRRVITVNLDPQMERPELRQFDFDPIERVLANRGNYIAAALTIGRAYVVAGRPDLLKKLASFEAWSDLVRSSLAWLGKADVVKSMESARAEDPERGELSDLLEAWATVMGREYSNRAKLSDVILKGTAMTRPGPQYDINDPVVLEPTYPELYTALEALAYRSTGKRGQKPDPRLLGNYLRKFKGKIVDGKRFAMEPDPKRGAVWWVEDIKAKQAPNLDVAAA